jgi:predicted transposase YdaD
MGLRFEESFASQLLEGVQNMHESTTYQVILREGREEGLLEGRNEGRIGEAQRLLLLQGEICFGHPDAATRSTLAAIYEIERLEELSRRVVDSRIHDWHTLMATP